MSRGLTRQAVSSAAASVASNGSRSSSAGRARQAALLVVRGRVPQRGQRPGEPVRPPVARRRRPPRRRTSCRRGRRTRSRVPTAPATSAVARHSTGSDTRSRVEADSRSPTAGPSSSSRATPGCRRSAPAPSRTTTVVAPVHGALEAGAGRPAGRRAARPARRRGPAVARRRRRPAADSPSPVRSCGSQRVHSQSRDGSATADEAKVTGAVPAGELRDQRRERQRQQPRRGRRRGRGRRPRPAARSPGCRSARGAHRRRDRPARPGPARRRREGSVPSPSRSSSASASVPPPLPEPGPRPGGGQQQRGRAGVRTVPRPRPRRHGLRDGLATRAHSTAYASLQRLRRLLAAGAVGHEGPERHQRREQHEQQVGRECVIGDQCDAGDERQRAIATTREPVPCRARPARSERAVRNGPGRGQVPRRAVDLRGARRRRAGRTTGTSSGGHQRQPACRPPGAPRRAQRPAAAGHRRSPSASVPLVEPRSWTVVTAGPAGRDPEHGVQPRDVGVVEPHRSLPPPGRYRARRAPARWTAPQSGPASTCSSSSPRRLAVAGTVDREDGAVQAAVALRGRRRRGGRRRRRRGAVAAADRAEQPRHGRRRAGCRRAPRPRPRRASPAPAGSTTVSTRSIPTCSRNRPGASRCVVHR